MTIVEPYDILFKYVSFVEKNIDQEKSKNNLLDPNNPGPREWPEHGFIRGCRKVGAIELKQIRTNSNDREYSRLLNIFLHLRKKGYEPEFKGYFEDENGKIYENSRGSNAYAKGLFYDIAVGNYFFLHQLDNLNSEELNKKDIVKKGKLFDRIYIDFIGKNSFF